jgi:orotidine-5'-phosphate decarboxylase
MLRQNLGNEFVIVSPGIRVAGDINNDDQKRTLTAYEAIKRGADYIVVGRPIRAAQEPLKECHKLVQEITAGLAER